jgi:hypothetical protein
MHVNDYKWKYQLRTEILAFSPLLVPITQAAPDRFEYFSQYRVGEDMRRKT